MKVKELMKRLQELDPETEIRISLRKGWRPHSTKSIEKVDTIIDQDTNRIGFYAIDVDMGLEYPMGEEKLIMPKDKNNEKYDVI
jgi:hypothetical protein